MKSIPCNMSELQTHRPNILRSYINKCREHTILLLTTHISSFDEILKLVSSDKFESVSLENFPSTSSLYRELTILSKLCSLYDTISNQIPFSALFSISEEAQQLQQRLLERHLVKLCYFESDSYIFVYRISELGRRVLARLYKRYTSQVSRNKEILIVALSDVERVPDIRISKILSQVAEYLSNYDIDPDPDVVTVTQFLFSFNELVSFPIEDTRSPNV